MSSAQFPSFRALSDHPDLRQLRRQAKELLKAFAAGDPGAVAEVNARYPDPRRTSLALHDAQLVLARSYGFDSWPKLKVYVDGVTVRRLGDAVRRGDLAAVRAMLDARPEMVNLCMAEDDEHRALHYAVLEQRPEIVRVLMQCGADARVGIWPHRVATGALTLADERGYADIATIIRDEEQRRAAVPLAGLEPSETAALRDAFGRGDEDAIIAAIDARPALVRASGPGGRTALHWAAAKLWPRLGAWLLSHGADVRARTHSGETPLDLLGDEGEVGASTGHLTTRLIELLLGRGAEQTARWAILVGDGDWLRARHAAGALANERRLLSHAVRWGRPEMLNLLLDLGLDPDETETVDGLDTVVTSWGGPLRECALRGDHTMADMLLTRGANPNTNVYAASCALSEAYTRHDTVMIERLEARGGRLAPVFVGGLGLVERARELLEEEAAGRTHGDVASTGSRVARDLLWGAIEGGSVEIVRMASERIDLSRDDPRWHGLLENALYLGDRDASPAHIEGFRLTLERSDPNIRSKRGATILHDIAASRGKLTAHDRVVFASLVLDAGGRLDLRDDLLRSTPLGWACRWGRIELTHLLLERGAIAIEPDAETWAQPMAWAEKMGHLDVLAVLRERL